MMIDTKKFEELCSERTELDAEVKVLTQIGKFIYPNIDRCRSEMNFYDLAVWQRQWREVSDRIAAIDERHRAIMYELDKMKEEA